MQPLRRSLPVLIQLAVSTVIVLCPMLLILAGAFSENAERDNLFDFGSFTFDNFAVLGSGTAQAALLNSALVGIGSSLVALVIGCLLAFLAARTDVPGRKLIYGISIMLLFLPALVGALAWALLAGPATGYLNLGFGAIGVPHLMVHSALSLMNPDLEDVASLHGAPVRRMLREATFPLVTPAVLGSAILVFALTVENFAVAQVIGVPGGVDTLPTLT